MRGKIALLYVSITLSVILDAPSALDLNQTEDGEEFIKKILHGQGAHDRKKQLMFTAPFKLCDGGRNCSSNNFGMVFPLYVGKVAEEKYKQLYSRDYDKIFNKKLNAPFKRKTTRRIFTLCPSNYRTTTTSISIGKFPELVSTSTSTRRPIVSITTSTSCPIVSITRSPIPPFDFTTPEPNPEEKGEKLPKESTSTTLHQNVPDVSFLYRNPYVPICCPNFYPYWFHG